MQRRIGVQRKCDAQLRNPIWIDAIRAADMCGHHVGRPFRHHDPGQTASEFNRRPNRPKGFTSYCRDCLRKRWRKWAYGEAA